MTRNITLSISDDVASQMDTMPEVNWSSVARQSIIQYIEVRKNPDISELLEKLQQQKGEEYMKGRIRADEVAERMGYARLDVIVQKYTKKAERVREMQVTGPDAPWESVPCVEDAMQETLIEQGIIGDNVSTEFAKGFTDRIFEIHAAISK